MPNFNVSQPNKQQNTVTRATPQNRQVNSPPTHPSSKHKVLDDSFLSPDSDDHGMISADSDEYELTDDELLDYARPGRRQAAEKQGIVSALPEDEDKVKEKKESTEVLQENEVKLNLKGKTNVTQKNPGLLSGLKK